MSEGLALGGHAFAAGLCAGLALAFVSVMVQRLTAHGFGLIHAPDFLPATLLALGLAGAAATALLVDALFCLFFDRWL
ncbi:hypothetical protein ACP2AV_10150 [Aliiroseovarius sp. PTFE2010]|uniref:hypothetical protein n=1 Tax=Aliiroseovarius sp. PTFE2010 TaxID=3417190 RepID=UPI003CF0028C